MHVQDLEVALGHWRPEVVHVGQLDRPVTSVMLLENEADVDRCEPDSVAILTRSLAATVRRYRVDVLLARASARDVAAIVVPTSQRLRLPRDSWTDLAILTVDEACDVASIVLAISQSLTGDAGLAITGARVAAQALGEAGHEPEALLHSLRAAVPGARFTASEGTGIAVRSTHPDDVGTYWTAPDRGEPWRTVDELLLRAANAQRAADAARRDAPQRSLATLLAEMISTRKPDATELEDRARFLGFDADGWHLVVLVSTSAPGLEPGAETTAGELQREEMIRTLAHRQLHQVARARWHWTQLGRDTHLIATWTRDPTRGGTRPLVEACRHLHAELAAELGDERTVALGVSAVHAGLDGLRRAAGEARSAVAATRSNSTPGFVEFDRLGIDQALLDWYSTQDARDSARRLLEPFTKLTPEKAELSLQTLQAYLDHQGSLTRTSEALFIHRNALKYRLTRIQALLDDDLTDPEYRLALHLACRGRHLLDLRVGKYETTE